MTKKLSELSPKEADWQREKVSAYQKKYYESNADRLRAKAREYGKQQRIEEPVKIRIKDRTRYIRSIEKKLFEGARLRSRKEGVPFEITVDDIKKAIPEDRCCPIFQKPFEIGIGKVSPRSMTLDRINPKLGYVPGNIAVISFIANTMKNNCGDPQLFRRWAAYLRQHAS